MHARSGAPAMRCPRHEPSPPVYEIGAQTAAFAGRAAREDGSRDWLFRVRLEELARPARACVVVLEDLHWADAATLDFLRFIGRRIQRTSAIFIATSTRASNSAKSAGFFPQRLHPRLLHDLRAREGRTGRSRADGDRAAPRFRGHGRNAAGHHHDHPCARAYAARRAGLDELLDEALRLCLPTSEVSRVARAAAARAERAWYAGDLAGVARESAIGLARVRGPMAPSRTVKRNSGPLRSLHPFVQRLAFIDDVDREKPERLLPHDLEPSMRHIAKVHNRCTGLHHDRRLPRVLHHRSL
jgi:hypothetical protein